MNYPPAERQELAELLHGELVRDPYRWLEDPAIPETKTWLAAQQELWARHVAALPGRDHLRARVAELSAVGTVTAPRWCGERQFFLRQSPGQEHAVLYTVGPDGGVHALLDPAERDPTGVTTLDHWQPDPTGRRLAYQLSRRGDEQSELYVLDVATRTVVDGPIGPCRYSPVAWLPDGTAFFYVRTKPDDRRVFLHRIGAGRDVPVFGGDPASSYGLGLSEDGRWLIVSASTGAYHDLWLADLGEAGPEAPEFRAVQEGVTARTVGNVGRDGRLYVVTDSAAPRGRLCIADPAHPGPAHWRELVPEDPDAVFADLTILDGPELERPLLLVGRSRHAIGEVTVHDLATGAWLAAVPLPGLGSVGSLSARAAGHEAWFTYADSATPPAVYRYDARTGETEPWAAAPGAVAVPDVESRQVLARSRDGTRIRLVVLARPSTVSGPRPTILYGYGGFGLSLTPSYSSFVLAWVEAGGVFATAHLRGGGEDGERWHRDGMLERKQNVFDDAIAAAEALIADGWTTPRHLGVCGESNGGLLAGAVVTQRPDLFAAAVCSAPLLDMVRYERSGLGPMWTAEYGSAGDPDQFRALLAYSPYHRVRPGVDYPAVLFTVFGGDSRVDPWHARKMCAALQHATTGARPILLRHEDDVGHGARAASRAEGLAADMLAFLAAQTGLAL
ncbi:MAG TPA: prolyl oligopeptidase family serine peptidase [Mycobacteriales bacterium]